MRPIAGILMTVSLGLLLGACADGIGPLPTGDAAGVMSAARSGTRTTAPTEPATLAPVRFAPWAPRLETYDTAFTVTQGKASSDTLYFKRNPLGVRMPYLVISTPKDAQFVDAAGSPLPKGSSVRLTVHADSQYVQLNFGPHGSTFSKNPATVMVSWFYTDLMGKSGADLKLWYQPDVNTTWNPLTTAVDLQFYWLVSKLDHFSNYAVAY